MRILKHLYRTLPARIVAALILASAGVILADLYAQVSVPLAMLGFVLVGLGLLLIPGFGAGGESPQEG